jgi:hypothetical protein
MTRLCNRRQVAPKPSVTAGKRETTLAASVHMLKVCLWNGQPSAALDELDTHGRLQGPYGQSSLLLSREGGRGRTLHYGPEDWDGPSFKTGHPTVIASRADATGPRGKRAAGPRSHNYAVPAHHILAAFLPKARCLAKPPRKHVLPTHGAIRPAEGAGSRHRLPLTHA